MGGGIKQISPCSGVLQQYSSSRQAMVICLSHLVAEDWWRTGQHDEFGQVTLLQQASYFARHERSHFPQRLTYGGRLVCSRTSSF